VRVDSHCFTGYTVPPFYDSLIAKLIVHADTRDQAIESMRQALDGFRIDGIITTVGFHREVMDEPDFINGQVTTRWVEQTFLPTRKTRQKELKAVQLAQQAAAES
jgi:acetyl-CoA carboxylase biotin carboxylase subunit